MDESSIDSETQITSFEDTWHWKAAEKRDAIKLHVCLTHQLKLSPRYKKRLEGKIA
jgi:hypothetical protein